MQPMTWIRFTNTLRKHISDLQLIQEPHNVGTLRLLPLTLQYMHLWNFLRCKRSGGEYLNQTH